MRAIGLLLGIVVLVALAGAGCQRGPVRPERAVVSGKVVTKQGKPCDGALVVLHPKAPGRGSDAKPVARAAEDGSLSFTTFEAGDGAVPGDYGVTVVWPAKAKEAAMSISGEGGGATGDQLSGRYGNPAATLLSVTVPPSGVTEWVIEVE